VPPDFVQKTKDVLCYRKTCAASVDASILIHEFLTRHETTVVHQPPYTPDLVPADFFLFPKWKSSLKGLRISDSRGDSRKFDTGPSHCPTKHVPGHVPEMGGGEKKKKKPAGSSVSRVEGSTLKVAGLIKL